MPEDRKYIRDYDDVTLIKIEKHLARTTFEGEAPWVAHWARARLSSIRSELQYRRQNGKQLISLP